MDHTTLPSPWRTYRRLLGYTTAYWRILLLALLGMVGDAACTTLFAKLIKPMLDRLFIDRDPKTIFWMPLWIIGVFAVRGVASYVSDYGMSYVGRSVVHDMRANVFDAYLTLPTGFFSNEANGHQVARITYTCEQVAQASTDAIKVALVDGLTVLGLAGVMLYYSPTLTLALLLMVPTVGLIAVRVSRSYRKVGQRVQTIMGTITSAISEVVLNHREVRIYGGQAHEARRFSEITRRAQQLNLKAASTAAGAAALIQFIAALALALIIVIATRPHILATMSPGTFFAVLMAMGGILPSLKRLSTVQANIQRGMVAAEDLFAVIDAPRERDTGRMPHARTLGELTFRHVEFTYQGQTRPALRKIDLTCHPGTVTAVVGRSGSGKSTLSSLVPRFYDPEAGHILLDGHDVRDYPLRSLRRQLAWVGQNIPLFDGTIAQNIAYGELSDVSRAEIQAAAQAANAWGFIEQFPLGLDHPIGMDGTLLSGGQRQRLAIARAILKNAPILILDEATSSLDTESEHLIQEALVRLMRHRTTLVIAHRLSTIQHADQIVVLDQGTIVERGVHADLMRADGAYARLYQLQFT